jgi:hypothetical protein
MLLPHEQQLDTDFSAASDHYELNGDARTVFSSEGKEKGESQHLGNRKGSRGQPNADVSGSPGQVR